MSQNLEMAPRPLSHCVIARGPVNTQLGSPNEYTPSFRPTSLQLYNDNNYIIIIIKISVKYVLGILDRNGAVCFDTLGIVVYIYLLLVNLVCDLI